MVTTPPRPLVSIILPVYNVADYLPRSFDSLLAQEYQELQFVVVNDGSPDNSGEIMRDYAARDPRFTLVFQDNAGVGAARNTGLAHATGEYLAFVDPDDYVTPDYISRMMQLAQRRDADVVVCNFFFQLPNGVRVPFPLMTPRRSMTGNQAAERALDLLSIPVFTWNKLYRRELFDGIVFPSMNYEDVATVTKVLTKAERVVLTRRPLYYYCLRSTSIVGSFDGRNIRDYLRAVEIMRQYIWDQGLWRDWRRAYRSFLRRVGAQLIISIESRRDLPLADRIDAVAAVAHEIKLLRPPPTAASQGVDPALELDEAADFPELIPRKK